MKQQLLTRWHDPIAKLAVKRLPKTCRTSAWVGGIFAVLIAIPGSGAQVLTIDTSGRGPVAGNGPVDRRYSQVTPTHVELSKIPLDPKTRMLLIRAIMSEQGFAMRPLPRGHKGLTLEANGKLEPAGEGYLNMVLSNGLSAKPGSRVVITDVKIDPTKIVFDLDGGPDPKHRILRHIHISVGPEMGDSDVDPSLADPNGGPTGSRITLAFHEHIPELTAADVKALLAPLLSFDVKSPIQAFTDTLPKELKDAILGHQVLVGMTTDMVLFAKGQPERKTREMEGQMPFEEWIYGTSPQEVDFVRINGNRVIRVEIARDGKPLQVFTEDVVSGMMRTDGTPVLTAKSTTRTVREGDVERDPDREEPAPPPTLRNPGEQLPPEQQGAAYGDMRPVQMPKPHKDDTPWANPDEQQSPPTADSKSQMPAGSQTPSDGSKPRSTPAPSTPPGGSQQPPAGSNQLVSTDAGASQRN